MTDKSESLIYQRRPDSNPRCPGDKKGFFSPDPNANRPLFHHGSPLISLSKSTVVCCGVKADSSAPYRLSPCYTFSLSPPSVSALTVTAAGWVGRWAFETLGESRTLWVMWALSFRSVNSNIRSARERAQEGRGETGEPTAPDRWLKGQKDIPDRSHQELNFKNDLLRQIKIQTYFVAQSVSISLSLLSFFFFFNPYLSLSELWLKLIGCL